jgi:Fe-S-cluster-containing dehydrogenase component
MKRLLIDVPALMESDVTPGKIQCEYMFHRGNEGQFVLLEVAEFASYCRRCRDSFCVAACPKEALEKQKNGLIRRYNMRCVGCKSCVLACPFGTIFPEVINYVTAKCDLCLNQLKADPDYRPACVRTAPANTFSMQEIPAEDPKNHVYFIGDHIAVRSPAWLDKEGRI